jgi:esterase/lipase superfamily enzyme
MHIEYHCWRSRSLNREMELKVYGHWGKPYIVFPCSRGRFYDFEDMGMIAAISGFIEAGHIKLFTVDSVDASSWYNFDISPAQRNAVHEAYDRYIVEEVMPFVQAHCSNTARVMATGCSMGAYHAVNFFLKHPDLFEGTIALSGLYRLDRKEFALSNADRPDVYFNSPLTYLPALVDPWFLDQYRQRTINVCVGQGDWEAEAMEDTREMATQFRDKGIPAWIDFWGFDVNHDWPWWYRQMNHFLAQMHG